MTTKEAIEVLTSANKWRRYDGDPEKHPDMPNPKQFGLAIDYAIEVLKRFEDSLDLGEELTTNVGVYKLYAIPKEQDNDL